MFQQHHASASDMWDDGGGEMTAGIDVGAEFLVLALGPLRLGGERPVEMTAEKPQRLLAALALQPNRWVSTGELTEALWPEGAPASARGNLKTYVHLLRQLLPPTGEQQRIDSRQGGYRLVVDRGELDVTAFEDLAGQAREALANGDPGTAAAVADAALRLWRGEPFESLCGPDVEIERVRLTELRRSAVDCRADALLAQDRADEVVALLRPLATADSLREATWERLMRALIEAGRPAEALRTYHELRAGLATELGTEPGAGPRRLYLQLLAADREAGEVRPLNPPVPTPPEPPFWRRRWKILAAAAIVVVLAAAGGIVAVRLTAAPRPVFDPGIAVIANARTPIVRRPVHLPPPGHLVFGIGDGVDSVLNMPFYQQSQASIGMVTQYYDATAAGTQLPAWQAGAIPRIYAAGKAVQLRVSVGYPEHVHDFIGPDGKQHMCGLAYVMSKDFLPDMKAVALAFAGKANGPPLYVSMFNGVEKTVCQEAYLATNANIAYFKELKVRYLQAVRIFHYYAPNARVGLDVDGWLNEGGDHTDGRNHTMLTYLEDVFKQSDFQSFTLFQGAEGDNLFAVQTMLPYLHQFGPVLVSRFSPEGGLPRFDSQSAALLNAANIRWMTDRGMFAWSYVDDTSISTTPQRLQFASNVVRQFGVPAR